MRDASLEHAKGDRLTAEELQARAIEAASIRLPESSRKELDADFSMPCLSAPLVELLALSKSGTECLAALQNYGDSLL